MAVPRTRTLRGAIAGAVAAGVWAAQQPLDMKLFGVPYDDTELLGKAVTRGPAWRPIGIGMHLANGALFGAAYANVRPLFPEVVPVWARAPIAGMAENFGLWPAVALTDRFHPARGDLPKLSGNRAALAQATWRHLLFAVVLGELERRLNAEPEEAPAPVEPHVASTNGHGTLPHVVTARPV